RLRRWFSAKDRSLGAMPAMFFARIIQGPARSFGWRSTPSIDSAMRITSATRTGSALRAEAVTRAAI
ncbi:MAG: hypothetical protein ACLQNV_18960, partial [Steroidobacteraceae bacterium]